MLRQSERAADLCAIPIECDIAGVDFECLANGCAHQKRAVRRCADRLTVYRPVNALHGNDSA